MQQQLELHIVLWKWSFERNKGWNLSWLYYGKKKKQNKTGKKSGMLFSSDLK